MAQLDVIAPTTPVPDALPVVRQIWIADLQQAIRSGLDDFRAMPTHVIYLCLIYPIVGLLLGRAAFGFDLVPLLFPLVAGFALIGPFAAIGLYELSRRREQGLDTSWRHAFDIRHSPSFRAIGALGLLLVAVFCVWVWVAHALYSNYLGPAEPATLQAFLDALIGTPGGHRLMLVGNVVGALFAITVFCISVISFPLLLDRNVGMHVAVVTSIRVVLANPVVMALWGMLITCALAVGSLPFLAGLAIVLPVLGHSSWHLYRQVIVPDDGPRPPLTKPDKPGRRYAAEFPASLFARSHLKSGE